MNALAMYQPLRSELLKRHAFYRQEEDLFLHVSSCPPEVSMVTKLLPPSTSLMSPFSPPSSPSLIPPPSSLPLVPIPPPPPTLQAVVEVGVSPRGRELRSGRTIPDSPEPLPPSPSTEPSAEESDAWVREDGEEDDEDEEGMGMRGYDAESTASSDISDWTTEAGISEINPVRRKTRRSRRYVDLMSSVHTCTNTWTLMHTHANTHGHTHANTHGHTHAHTCKHTWTLMHTHSLHSCVYDVLTHARTQGHSCLSHRDQQNNTRLTSSALTH